MSSIYKKSVNSTTARIHEDFAAETLNQKRKIMADLKSIYKKLSPKPLDGTELERWYIDAVAGRGDDPVWKLMRRLQDEPGGHLQILFSGYRGCGKSTELNKMTREIEDDMLVLNYSVLKELDPVTLNYVELFVITMEKLFELSGKHHLAISPDLLRSVHEWIQSVEIERTREMGADIGIETGAEAEVSVPFLSKIFGKMRASANASYRNKKTIVETIEPRLSDLIVYCNDLIREVKLRLPDIGKKGLLVIIEDLDKLSVEKAEELFFKNSFILTRLQAHVIFTFPISLRHHRNAKLIRANFDEDFELPMVKVHEKDGTPFEAGIDKLREIVECRIDKECFETQQLLERIIKDSGGCLWDLFKLIRDASDNALLRKGESINDDDYLRSFRMLRRDYENSIAEKRVDHQVVISVDDYYRVLDDLVKSKTKRIDNNDAALDLRQSLCILGYNGDWWCDVHPIVRTILDERKQELTR